MSADNQRPNVDLDDELLDYEEESNAAAGGTAAGDDQNRDTMRTIKAKVLEEIAGLCYPGLITPRMEAVIEAALEATPGATCLNDLVRADEGVTDRVFESSPSQQAQLQQQSSQYLSSEWQEGASKDAGFQAVIEKGQVPWVGGMQGSMNSYYLTEDVPGVIRYIPKEHAAFLTRSAIPFGFNTGRLHTRTKSVVVGSEAISWLKSGFEGLASPLSVFGSGRMVAWYDIPKYKDGLASTLMPVGLPEVEWLEAHHSANSGGPGFSTADLFALPAVLYMLYYFPAQAMPAIAAVGSIEQQRSIVFNKLMNKTGLEDQQARKDIDEIMVMLLRYILVQTEVIPKVFEFGTGDWAQQPTFKGCYVRFWPADPRLAPDQYQGAEAEKYRLTLELVKQCAAGVIEHTKEIVVAPRETWPDAAVLDMSGFAYKLACYAMMPKQPHTFWEEAFWHYRDGWFAANSTSAPQLHFYNGSKWLAEKTLNPGVLENKLRELKRQQDAPAAAAAAAAERRQGAAPPQGTGAAAAAAGGSSNGRETTAGGPDPTVTPRHQQFRPFTPGRGNRYGGGGSSSSGEGSSGYGRFAPYSYTNTAGRTGDRGDNSRGGRGQFRGGMAAGRGRGRGRGWEDGNPMAGRGSGPNRRGGPAGYHNHRFQNPRG